MNTQEKKRRLKKTPLILCGMALITIIYILFSKGILYTTNKENRLVYEKDILNLNISENHYIGINNDQLFKITRDGIIGYNFEGQEIWADALSLDSYVVRQREPYIAVADKLGKKISLFSDKGKQGEINCQNPILYFSINEKGSVAIIEDLSEAHAISAYDVKGRYLGGRVTYAKDEGYPTVVEISPNDDLVLANYINLNNPMLTSHLIAIKPNELTGDKVDEVDYGIEQKDSLIYEIEFLKSNEWVSISDKNISWYDLEGSKIAEQSGIVSVFNPYIGKMNKYGQGYLPIISTDSATQNTIHRSDSLVYFNAKGEETFNIKIGEPVTYFDANDKGVVVGTRDSFQGFNKLGVKLFEYVPTLSVNKVFYIPENKIGIAVTKEKVMLLQSKKKEKE